MRKFLFASILLVILTGVVAVFFLIPGSVPVRIRASVDRSAIEIGETVRLSVIIQSRKNINIFSVNEDIKSALSGFETKKHKTTNKAYFSEKVEEREYIFTQYLPGKYVIPAIIVKYRRVPDGPSGEVKSDPIKMTVKSLLPKNFSIEPQKVRISGGPVFKGIQRDSQDDSSRTIDAPIRFGIKDSVRPKNISIANKKARQMAFITIACLLGVFGVFFIYRFTQRKKEVILAPHEEAVLGIEHIRNEDLYGAGDWREYCFRLTEVLIRYLKRRYGIEQIEMTTEEFLDAIDKITDLDEKKTSYCKKLLRVCDHVKYANDMSPKGLEIPRLKDVFDLIEETANENKMEG